jgi:hypothetical protein
MTFYGIFLRGAKTFEDRGAASQEGDCLRLLHFCVQISQIKQIAPTAVVDIIHGLGRLHGSTHTTPPPTTLYK